jgi:hypothetical protein
MIIAEFTNLETQSAFRVRSQHYLENSFAIGMD